MVSLLKLTMSEKMVDPPRALYPTIAF